MGSRFVVLRVSPREDNGGQTQPSGPRGTHSEFLWERGS